MTAINIEIFMYIIVGGGVMTVDQQYHLQCQE
jgi:hypothetical protein